MARRLYAWVRDHIEYYAIEVGVGGFRPHAADEVLHERYGDCKDKANLLHELLAAVGIPSRLVLLYAHDGLPRAFGLPTGDNFNHVIVEVSLPSGKVLADPTASTVAFGALPAMDQEVEALPVTAEGAPLLRTPGNRPEDNAEEVTVELLPVGRDLAGQLGAVVHGTPADQLRSGLMNSTADKRTQVISRVLGVERGVLSKLSIHDERPPELPTPVKIAAQLRYPRLAGGERFLLKLAELLDAPIAPLPFDKRTTPVVLPGRTRLLHQVRLSLDGLEVRSTPADVKIEEPIGTYELTWSREEDVLVVTRRLELREHVFAAAQYDALRSFIERILVAETRAAAVHRKGETK
jgi:hypothetical protein